MPILKPEPNQSPPDLLNQPATRRDLGPRRWWVLYTLSRQEKALLRSLHGRGLDYYCPLVPHQYRSPTGRRRTSYLPLFSSYVFFRGTEEDRLAALASGCISKCIEVTEPELLVRQLRSVDLLVAAGRPLTIESTWQPGTPVRIKTGAMAGVEGQIVERRGDHRLLVEVTLLHRALSVSIEDWDLERL